MTTIGYIRVSTDKQDLEKQEHLLLEYAQHHQLLINEFINVEISSRKNTQERRIDELFKYFVQHDEALLPVWRARTENGAGKLARPSILVNHETL